MNIAPPHLEAAPAPAGTARKVGDIWREGGKWYERVAAGVWRLPTIEREPLLFGYRARGRRLDMPCLESAGRSLAAVNAERVECFDENRFEIRRGLRMDEVEFSDLIENTEWLDALQGRVS
mgnify:FL=1